MKLAHNDIEKLFWAEMKRGGALLLALAAAACGGPPAGGEDLPPGARRVAATAMPTAEQIASACFTKERESCRGESASGPYCEPPEGDYLVRAPSCSRVRDDPAAADCRFGATVMPWGAPEESYRRLRPRDYDPVGARFVFVEALGGPRWLAATYCR